jgi:alpha-galactosidase
MKKICAAILLFAAFIIVVSGQSDILIPVSTQNTDLIFKVGNDHRLYQVYYGPKLVQTPDSKTFPRPAHLAYVTSGTDNLFEPAIRVTHNDGNPSLELNYVNHQTEKSDENVTITRIRLKDPQYPV